LDAIEKIDGFIGEMDLNLPSRRKDKGGRRAENSNSHGSHHQIRG
jgi:hypothetical protein